jgi:hypothetical protein
MSCLLVVPARDERSGATVHSYSPWRVFLDLS